jgi:hypothetical protein
MDVLWLVALTALITSLIGYSLASHAWDKAVTNTKEINRLKRGLASLEEELL